MQRRNGQLDTPGSWAVSLHYPESSGLFLVFWPAPLTALLPQVISGWKPTKNQLRRTRPGWRVSQRGRRYCSEWWRSTSLDAAPPLLSARPSPSRRSWVREETAMIERHSTQRPWFKTCHTSLRTHFPALVPVSTDVKKNDISLKSLALGLSCYTWIISWPHPASKKE